MSTVYLIFGIVGWSAAAVVLWIYVGIERIRRVGVSREPRGFEVKKSGERK